MNYTENFEGIKLDIQAVDLTISDTLQQQIRDSIVKLKRHASSIAWADVYFKEEEQHNTNTKTVSIRLGVPGPDVFASDSGNAWMPLLKSVEEKLSKQLQKQ